MTDRIRRIVVQSLICIVVAFCGTTLHGADDDIRPYVKNPRYWQYRGKPVLLLGGSVEDNLFQIPELIKQLDLLESVGGNYVRNTMSSRDEGNVWPFKMVDGKYDLDQWNDQYWQRFDTFLKETQKRSIIVQIEVWATFDYYRDPWEKHNPFAPKNNRTYTTKSSGLPNRVDSHPLQLRNPFVRSIPSEENLPIVLKYQEKFVEKLLSYSLQYGNVLYCMDNETAASPAWSEHWAMFIRRHAEQAGKTVYLTEMRDPWDILDRKHDVTFDNPQLYGFVDISQNNHNKGQKHYDLPQRRRQQIADNPRPLNNVKVYGADTGRFGNSRDGIERFWRNIFGGLAATRFHRPDSGLGLSPQAQRNIHSAREVTDAFDIFSCEPHNDLLSERSENEAYCLANPAGQFAVYFPAAGDVRLKLQPTVQAKARLRWYDIDHGKWQPAIDISRDSVILKTPSDGQWAAVIAAE